MRSNAAAASSRVRLAPLATWGLSGAGYGIGDVWHTARMLGVFALVLGVAFAAERDAAAENHAAPTQARPRAGAVGRFRRSSTA